MPFLLGLLLLADPVNTSCILVAKVKNKIAGILVMVAGLACTLFPLAVLMFMIAVPTQG
jgi:hypothetical protein